MNPPPAFRADDFLSVTSSKSALSRTLRHSACCTTKPAQCPLGSGPQGVRPREGLSPTSPQHEAGMRIEVEGKHPYDRFRGRLEAPSRLLRRRLPSVPPAGGAEVIEPSQRDWWGYRRVMCMT